MSGLQFLAPLHMLAVQPQLVTEHLCASFSQAATAHQKLQQARAVIFSKGANVSKPDSPPQAGLRSRIDAGPERRRLTAGGVAASGRIRKNRVWRSGPLHSCLLASRGQAEPTSRIVLGSPRLCGSVPGHAVARLCAASSLPPSPGSLSIIRGPNNLHLIC